MKLFFSVVIFSLSVILNAQTIKEIKFNNLSRISPKIATETVKLKPGDTLDIKKINYSIKEFYNFGYFDDIWVEDNQSIITFYFKEKPSIANIDIKGYKTREEDLDLLYTVMGVKKGSLYSKTRVAKAKKALLQELAKEGYINSVVEIEVEDINEYSVSVTFNVNKGDKIIIKKVNYHGAKNLSEDDFEDVTANKEEDYVSWWFGQNDGELKLDQLPYDHLRINDLYYQHGYLEAKVKKPFLKINFSSNQAKLDFFIKEGIQYFVKDIKIYLDSSILDPKTLYPELKLSKDKVFNIQKLRKDVNFIKTSVANLGYAFTEVKYDLRNNKENNTTDIIYNVIPGDKVYINDIIISGNSRTLDRVIRRNIYLAPGDLFNLTDFKDSRSSLKRTGFFEDVTIEQKRIAKDKMDLLVSVKEAPTGSLIVGGGYGSYDGWMLNASVSDKNIFGSGLNLGFSIDYSKRRNIYKVSLINPAIRDSKYSGNVEVHKSESEVVSTDYTLIQKSSGGAVGIGKRLTRHIHAGIKYTLDKITDEYDTKPEDNNEYIVSSITPYISFNNTDDYFIPRRGIITGTSLEKAGLGGDANFIKSSTYFKTFYGLEDQLDFDLILRYKASVKLLEDTGQLTQGDSFYLGGPSSVRGYQSYAFGPVSDEDPYTKYFANTIELSFPLIPKARMRWSLFYDYGMIGQNKFTEIKKSGRGVVVEWYSPVGPLQFIFSRAINPGPDDKTSNFEFNLGRSF